MAVKKREVTFLLQIQEIFDFGTTFSLSLGWLGKFALLAHHLLEDFFHFFASYCCKFKENPTAFVLLQHIFSSDVHLIAKDEILLDILWYRSKNICTIKWVCIRLFPLNLFFSI